MGDSSESLSPEEKIAVEMCKDENERSIWLSVANFKTLYIDDGEVTSLALIVSRTLMALRADGATLAYLDVDLALDNAIERIEVPVSPIFTNETFDAFKCELVCFIWDDFILNLRQLLCDDETDQLWYFDGFPHTLKLFEATEKQTVDLMLERFELPIHRERLH
jgi:hypothetical protein